MKVIHPPDQPIIPGDCYTKAAYARHIRKSHTWVNRLIEDGELTVIVIQGNELVKKPKAMRCND